MIATHITSYRRKIPGKSNKTGKNGWKRFTNDKPHTRRLTFPDIEVINRHVKLPRFSTLLKDTREKCVGLDDLDVLQLELETLLSAVVIRSHILHKELCILNGTHELSGTVKERDKVETFVSIGKETYVNHIPNKKSRGLNEISGSIGKETYVKHTSNKNGRELNETSLFIVKETDVKHTPNKNSRELNKTRVPLISTRVNSYTSPQLEHAPPSQEVKTPKYLKRKHDAPNRFWTSISSYCGNITSHDLHFVDDLIKEQESIYDVNICPVNRSYSVRWAQEELRNEQIASHWEGRNKAKRTITPERSEKLLQESKISVEGPTAEILTQRLLSALKEENLKLPESEENCVASIHLQKKENNFSPENRENNKHFKQVHSRLMKCVRVKLNGKSDCHFISDVQTAYKEENIRNIETEGGNKTCNVELESGIFRKYRGGYSSSLETRLREALEVEGILERIPIQKKTLEGEIFQEFNSCQEELKVINNLNANNLKHLLALGNAEVIQQELRRRLELVGSKVCDMYRSIKEGKKKEESLSQVDHELCLKSLHEHRLLLKQVNLI